MASLAGHCERDRFSADRRGDGKPGRRRSERPTLSRRTRSEHRQRDARDARFPRGRGKLLPTAGCACTRAKQELHSVRVTRLRFLQGESVRLARVAPASTCKRQRPNRSKGDLAGVPADVSPCRSGGRGCCLSTKPTAGPATRSSRPRMFVRASTRGDAAGAVRAIALTANAVERAAKRRLCAPR
jgi:hypothetical protein